MTGPRPHCLAICLLHASLKTHVMDIHFPSRSTEDGCASALRPRLACRQQGASWPGPPHRLQAAAGSLGQAEGDTREGPSIAPVWHAVVVMKCTLDPSACHYPGPSSQPCHQKAGIPRGRDSIRRTQWISAYTCYGKACEGKVERQAP